MLNPTLDYLYRFDEFEPSQARPQVAYQLNRWAEGQPKLPESPEEPLLTRLPKDVRDLPQLAKLQQFQFTLDDVEFLQEAVWLRSVANWVGKQAPPAHLAKWLESLEGEGRGSAAKPLAVAERLFDWTVRNIQLDPLLDYPTVTTAGPDTQPVGAGASAAPASPPRLGIPGPGYQRLPWQTVLYGHGDAWERARVFMLLARQQGLDSVMLAIDEEFAARPRPWAVGVLIGEQVYLFDTALGLPIPGPQGKGIATLGELREAPELVRALDLDAERTYPVKEADLKRLVVLFDAAPQALMPRMKAIEEALSGERQLKLTTSPSVLEERLKGIPGVVGMRLWALPYEALLFRDGIRRRAQQDPSAIIQYLQEMSFFERLNPVVQGRHQHLMGQFDSQDSRSGAKATYLSARTAKSVLTSMTSDTDLQRGMGLVRQPDEKEEAFTARLETLKGMMTLAKNNASYWLGLVQFETQNYSAAIDWFRERTIEGAPDSPWVPSAKYNLARSYEAMGEFDKAKEILFVDESPQSHGNILRARRLGMSP